MLCTAILFLAALDLLVRCQSAGLQILHWRTQAARHCSGYTLYIAPGRIILFEDRLNHIGFSATSDLEGMMTNWDQRFIGFDISQPLKQTTLEQLKTIGFQTCGAYLTWPVRRSEKNPRKRGWIQLCSYLRTHGWGIFPIAFGYNNSPDTGAKNTQGVLLSDDPIFANEESGARHGKFISDIMRDDCGFPPGSIVYIDVEDASVSKAYKTYLSSLFTAITADGYTVGVYCHKTNNIAIKMTKYQYLINWKPGTHKKPLNFEDVDEGLMRDYFLNGSVISQVFADMKPFIYKGTKQNIEGSDIDIDICGVRDPSSKSDVDTYLSKGS